MTELKTQLNDADPAAYLAGVEPAGRRSDAEAVAEMRARYACDAADL
ncbi:MAG: hypothetical protein AAF366_13810 [Pseudomonadota bacterium]